MKNILNKKQDNFSLKKLEWKKIQLDMREKLGSDIYESWLKKIDFVEEFNNYILISVSTRFIRDWITSRYLDQILKIVKIHKKEINRIEFAIHEQRKEIIDVKKKIDEKNDNKNVSFIWLRPSNFSLLISFFSKILNSILIICFLCFLIVCKI